jgi:hypothetical protein
VLYAIYFLKILSSPDRHCGDCPSRMGSIGMVRSPGLS